MFKGVYVTLSCEIQAAYWGTVVLIKPPIEVLYVELYETVCPGWSQAKVTTRPGLVSEVRLWVMDALYPSIKRSGSLVTDNQG